MIKRILVLSMLTAVVMVLCSCGKPDIRKTSSRIAPQVNREQTSTYQIDSVLAPNNSMMPAQAGQAAALARQRIGDQELLAQEALQARLDRDAPVAQAIEHARRQVLARAYIERAAISASQAGPEEIKKFYEGNPALFERRRTYRVLEVVVVVPPEQFGRLQDTVAGAKNLAEVVHWLDSRKHSFEASESSRAAEQIPMNILRRLFEMRDGQIAVFPTPRGVSVIQLEQSVEAPLSEKQAGPAIARYLLNLKRLELAQAAVAKLRARAKIDYDGIELGRPTTVAQAAEQVKPQVAGPAMTHNTTDLARLR